MFDEAQTNPDVATQAFEWQQSRRRPDGHFDAPIRGFMDGSMTLWLPSASVEQRVVFRDGEPVSQQVESVMTQPAIAQLRSDVLRSFQADVHQIDFKFFRYAAAVVQLNYTVNDEDLTQLLTGTAWHKGMFKHLFLGDELMETVMSMAPGLVEAIERQPDMLAGLAAEFDAGPFQDPPRPRRLRDKLAKLFSKKG